MYRSYYQSYNIRSQVNRARKPRQGHTDLVMSAEQIWAAAAYADRMNGGEYRKEPEYEVRSDGTLTPNVVRPANKFLMWNAIMDTNLITDSDIDTGRQARDYVRKSLVFRRLKGTVPNEFEVALSRAVEMDEFLTGADRYEIALVTSQIRAWREGTRMETVMADVNHEPVAPVGAKIQLNVQVVKSVYSANFNVYFITAKTDANQMVFFSYRDKRPVGEQMSIRGTVKAHRPDATQLNRVRII